MGCLAREEVVAKRIAVVAFRGIELVERVVLDGVDIDNGRSRQTGTDRTKRGCDYKWKDNFREVCGLGIHFINVWIIPEKLKC